MGSALALRARVRLLEHRLLRFGARSQGRRGVLFRYRARLSGLGCVPFLSDASSGLFERRTFRVGTGTGGQRRFFLGTSGRAGRIGEAALRLGARKCGRLRRAFELGAGARGALAFVGRRFALRGHGLRGSDGRGELGRGFQLPSARGHIAFRDFTRHARARLLDRGLVDAGAVGVRRRFVPAIPGTRLHALRLGAPQCLREEPAARERPIVARARRTLEAIE